MAYVEPARRQLTNSSADCGKFPMLLYPKLRAELALFDKDNTC
jgi:hypothetical protein